MKAKVTWKGRMSFDGTSNSGFVLPLGSVPEVGGDNDGFLPMELFLIGLAGCTGMDVISILQKKHQQIATFEVSVTADRSQTHPKIFTRILIEYILSGQNLERDAIERAVELSETKYCPAQAILTKTASIEHKINIVDG